MTKSSVFRGIVHGKIIELDQELGLPEGQSVEVTVQPVNVSTSTSEGLQKAFSAWSDEEEDLDKYLEWNRNQRKDREAIQAGLGDMEAGRVVSFEEVDDRIRAKLGCEKR